MTGATAQRPGGRRGPSPLCRPSLHRVIRPYKCDTHGLPCTRLAARRPRCSARHGGAPDRHSAAAGQHFAAAACTNGRGWGLAHSLVRMQRRHHGVLTRRKALWQWAQWGALSSAPAGQPLQRAACVLLVGAQQGDTSNDTAALFGCSSNAEVLERAKGLAQIAEQLVAETSLASRSGRRRLTQRCSVIWQQAGCHTSLRAALTARPEASARVRAPAAAHLPLTGWLRTGACGCSSRRASGGGAASCFNRWRARSTGVLLLGRRAATLQLRSGHAPGVRRW